MSDKSFGLTFARCVHYTPGKMDREPWSRYEMATVRATMFRVSPNPMLSETEDSFEIEVDGVVVGWGDTKEQAVHDARYRLMDKSRTEAESRESQRVAAIS